MGVAKSTIAENIYAPWNWLWPRKGDKLTEHTSTSSFGGVTPLVYKRRGSMYMDEDGDMAHEFYEEKTFGRSVLRTRMVLKTTQLKPQGDVVLDFPRLNADLPVVMCEFR